MVTRIETGNPMVITHSHQMVLGQCLSSDYLGNFIQHSTDQVIITMPAKAGGSSIKSFALACNDDSYKKLGDNFLNDPYKTEQLMTASYEMPGVIASHIYKATTLIRLIKNLPSGTLLVYPHRHETSRVISAVQEVLDKRCKGGTPRMEKEKTEVFEKVDGSDCYVSEGKLVQLIKAGTAEIGAGATSLLTCETFDAIETYAPAMLFMDYRKVGQVQEPLAKKYCPDVDTVFKTNVAAKKEVMIYVQLNGYRNTTVRLKDWLMTKSSTLEFAMGLNSDATCVAKLRMMEEKLQSCSDGYFMPYRAIH